MKIKYAELIDQTLYFPQEEFKYEDQQLYFHDIPLMDLVEKFGNLKFSYLPKISQNIQRAKTWFKDAIKRMNIKFLQILLLYQIFALFFRIRRSAKE